MSTAVPPVPSSPASTPTQSLDTLLSAALTDAAAGGYGPGVAETSISDESIGGDEFPAYKIVKGRKDRLSFLTSKNVVHARTHYIDGSGFLICLSEFRKQGDQEVMIRQAECCKRLDRCRKRCVGLVMKWATNHAGALQKADPPFQLMVWRFNDRTFGKLRDLNSQFPLDQHDFFVTLDGDEKYQGCTLMPVAGVSAANHPAVVAKYGAEITNWVSAMKPQLERTIGRRVDAAKWAEILKSAPTAGAAPAPPVSTEDGTQALEDLLQS
jgi:hypothetical protein